MVYEFRVYEPTEGNAAALRHRFLDVVATTFFPRHGIDLVGVFTSRSDQNLVYVVRFADDEASRKAWAGFGADPDWAKAKAASETSGPLLKRQTVSVLDPALAGLLLS